MPGIFNNIYHQMHMSLQNPSHFESQLSGSTCCTVMFDRNVVFCANAGDSRAVLYSYDRQQNGMTIQAMSVDHKPQMKSEK